ncbi:MAG: sulfurtransferase TusA family protein [Gammaproteobacteria bacterium]
MNEAKKVRAVAMGLFGKSKQVKDEGSAALSTVDVPGVGTLAITRQVNCLGDSCPRPQLLTKKALGQVNDGDVVEVLIDNPSSVEAIPPMMVELQSTHLATIKDPRQWRVYVRKGAA